MLGHYVLVTDYLGHRRYCDDRCHVCTAATMGRCDVDDCVVSDSTHGLVARGTQPTSYLAWHNEMSHVGITTIKTRPLPGDVKDHHA